MLVLLVLYCCGCAGAGAVAAGAGAGGAGAGAELDWYGVVLFVLLIRCRGNALPESRVLTCLHGFLCLYMICAVHYV